MAAEGARRPLTKHCRRGFHCPGASTLEALGRNDERAAAIEGLKSADLVDAMGRRHRHRHRCHLLGLVSPTPGRVLFGPSVTISFFPTCRATNDRERYNFGNLFYEAVRDEPSGKVLVLARNGYTDVRWVEG